MPNEETGRCEFPCCTRHAKYQISRPNFGNSLSCTAHLVEIVEMVIPQEDNNAVIMRLRNAISVAR